MQDTQKKFVDLERARNWPPKLAPLLSKVIPIYRQRALTEKLIPEQYEKRLMIASNFFTQLDGALSSVDFHMELEPTIGPAPAPVPTPGMIWSHKTVEQIQDLEVKSGVKFRNIKDTIAVYLANPWLQCNYVEWVMLDAMLYHEVISERDFIIDETGLDKHNQDAIFQEKLDRLAAPPWKAAAVAIGLVALPLIIIASLALLRETMSLFVFCGIYFIVLAAYLSYLPVTSKDKKRKLADLQSKSRGLHLLIKSYRYCEPPLICPAMLSKYLMEAQDQGVFIDGAFYSLLNTIKQRSENTFLTFL